MKTFNKFFESNFNYNESVKLDREYETSMIEKECYINFFDDYKDINFSRVIVYWGVVIDEEGNFGISNLDIIVKKVECEFKIEILNDESDVIEEKTENVTYETKDIKIEKNFQHRDDFERIPIFPSEVNIDYAAKKCEVIFN
jgi:hypothetical protein